MLPGCVIDEGLRLIFGEVVGFELFYGRDAGPVILRRRACLRQSQDIGQITFNFPSDLFISAQL